MRVRGADGDDDAMARRQHDGQRSAGGPYGGHQVQGRRPSVCSVHGIVHETPRNEPDEARHPRTGQDRTRGAVPSGWPLA
jgi:hypothetical protein